MIRRGVLAIACATASCSNPAGLDRSTDVGSIAVEPVTTTIVVGSSTPLKAIVQDVAGRPLADASVFWSVKDAQIARVSASGVVTAVAVGSTQVAASAGGRSALATITVQRPPVASVAVRPAQAEAITGARVQLVATTYDAGNAALTDRAVAWASSNERVATVDAAGLVTAIGAGTATITAASEGKSGTASLVVTDGPVASVAVTPATVATMVGQTTPLTATLRNANGATVTGRAVVWASSNPLVATVNATGVVTAVRAGTAAITATSEGVSGSATVTVANVPVRSVQLDASALALDVGATSTVRATVVDANGTVVTDRVVTWTSSNPLVASVSSSGVVTAVAAGSATITATSEGKSASVTVSVSPPAVASVTVTPSSRTLTVGQTTALTATPKSSGGAVLTGRSVTWSSNFDAIATVSPDGVVTARSPGIAIITATSEGRTGSATITVQAGPADVVYVTPSVVWLQVGDAAQLSATAFDVDGNWITGRTFAWSTSDAAVATVSSSGVVTARRPGVVTIRATLDGKSDASLVTVFR